MLLRTQLTRETERRTGLLRRGHRASLWVANEAFGVLAQPRMIEGFRGFGTTSAVAIQETAHSIELFGRSTRATQESTEATEAFARATEATEPTPARGRVFLIGTNYVGGLLTPQHEMHKRLLVVLGPCLAGFIFVTHLFEEPVWVMEENVYSTKQCDARNSLRQWAEENLDRRRLCWIMQIVRPMFK